MHKNPLWLILLLVIAITALFFIGRGAQAIYQHTAYSEQAVAEGVEWTTVELDGAFYPQATFSYSVGDQIMQGTAVLSEQRFRNEWGAAKALETFQQYTWKVWYQKDAPERVTMEHSYPWRAVVYACVMLGLLIYFVGLGYYVGGLNK